ncbi:MAG: HD domain-containing protein [Candidatus Hodarchaeota archaeon]
MISDKDIVHLYEKYQTPTRIQDHQRVVATVVMVIGRRLNEAGWNLNLKVVRAAAFLHDIGKIFQLEPERMKSLKDIIHKKENLHHAMIGRRILEKENAPEIGRLTSLHVGSVFLRQPELYTGEEEKLLLLGDMRVIEDEVCNIEIRMDYIEKRYGLIYGKGKELILGLEGEYFSAINLKPPELGELVQKEGLVSLER